MAVVEDGLTRIMAGPATAFGSCVLVFPGPPTGDWFVFGSPPVGVEEEPPLGSCGLPLLPGPPTGVAFVFGSVGEVCPPVVGVVSA